MVQRAHETARGVIEIGGVGERERVQHRRLLRNDGGGGILGGFGGSCCGHGAVLPGGMFYF